jgi:hypothetical protein
MVITVALLRLATAHLEPSLPCKQGGDGTTQVFTRLVYEQHEAKEKQPAESELKENRARIELFMIDDVTAAKTDQEDAKLSRRSKHPRFGDAIAFRFSGASCCRLREEEESEPPQSKQPSFLVASIP